MTDIWAEFSPAPPRQSAPSNDPWAEFTPAPPRERENTVTARPAGRQLQMPAYDAAGSPTGYQDDVDVPVAANSPSAAIRQTDDILKGIGGGLVRGVAGFAGAPAMIADILTKGGDRVAQVVTGESYEDMQRRVADRRANVMFPGVGEAISPEGIQRGIESVTGPAYVPETRAGKFASAAAEFAPGGMIGRPANIVGNTLRYGVAPGLASEAGGQAFEGSAMETPARIGGALVAGIGAAATQRAGSAERLLHQSTRGTTTAELDAMEDLFQQSIQAGTPISRSEALQAVTNGRTGIGDLQHTVEGMGGMRDFYAARPANNQRAAADAFDNIAPRAADPDQLGPQIGRASEDIVRDVERTRTNATSPYYQRANSEHVPTPEMQQFISGLDNAIASDTTGIIGDRLREIRSLLVEAPATPGRPAVPATRTARDTPNGRIYDTTPGTPAQPGMPERLITDIENLDRVRKYVRDRIDMPQIGADAITKEQGAAITRHLDNLRARMVANSSNFAAGKQAHQDITRRYVEPLMNGPIGKLASRDTTTKQAIDVLFPTNPLPGSEGAITTAVRAMVGRQPAAARALVRTHAEMTFNEAAQRLASSGPTQSGGAKFAAVLRGNEQQARNLEAAVRALPDGNAIWPGFNQLLNIFEAQQFRQATGSRTAFKIPGVEDLKSGGLANNAAQVIAGGGFKWPQKAQNAIQNWNVGRNLDELAGLLTRPDAAAEFRRLVQAPSGSSQAAAHATRLSYLALSAPRDRWSVTARPADARR